MANTLTEIVDDLPEPLSERARSLSNTTATPDGEFVLYWMRTAVRADENPALDTALTIANQLELPVFVYHALSERYPYASDRHHTFILEGARDVHRHFSELGIAYAFHLERPGHRGPHLKTLADRAAVVVTEEMPVQPLNKWTQLLCRQTNTPVLAVDTACVAPMQLVGKAYERAFAFRKATKKLYQERTTRKLPSIEPAVSLGIPADLPFEPIDFDAQQIHELVAQCEIDHLIGPVPHTRGGSAAGYARWEAFRDHKLKRYAKTRNNPLLDSVSRMSAYLHYGMVSPLRIAREAAELDNEGAEKYLDELLIWRELAYVFCFYRGDQDHLSALPDWAIETLADHESDARPALLSWEMLARGQSQDVLWDAAQQSLLIHGELHNNVRMTWGKALLNWTKNSKHALATMIDLNHRYTLDGRDPASYGGILWCLGQFDRPFPPARPIFGTVRDRSTEYHANRLDTQAYRQQTTRPLFANSPTVAVIGAGMSGLLCARTLQDHGIDVTVFEKSRGPGGRMSTRRTDSELYFDHGAQYFTARDPRFQRYVESWQHDGLVDRWTARIVVLDDGKITAEKQGTNRYVATPGMNSLCRHLADDLSVQYTCRVQPPRRQDSYWLLESEDGHPLGQFDYVLTSAPAPQSADLLVAAPDLARCATNARMSGCWAVMLALPTGLELPYGAAFVHHSPLSWIACNSRKPQRQPHPENWVLHASPEWSEQNLERTADDIQHELIAEFWKVVGLAPSEIEYATAHRWRYALPTEPLESRCLFDDNLQIGACGDWCGGPRVEGAFLSGSALAGRVLGSLAEQSPAEAVERQRSLQF